MAGIRIKVGGEFVTIPLVNDITIVQNFEKKSLNLKWEDGNVESDYSYNVFRKNNVNDKQYIHQNDDFVFVGKCTSGNTITDYTVGNNQTYCYQLELCEGGNTFSYSEPITTRWDGWSISALTKKEDYLGLEQYIIGDTWNFVAGINEGSITQNTEFQIHNGTSQYGQVSRGNTNYDSGTFTANLLTLQCPDIVIDDIYKVKQWNKFIFENLYFLLKSDKGDVWIVSITDKPTRQYEQFIQLPTIVTYNWIEVADISKAVIIDG